MTKTLTFVRLDFITVKPYLTLKTLVLFVAMALIMSLSTGGSSVVISIFIAYSTIYVSYPFAVGEKNGIDMLYSTLSISRKNVVSGRYLFAVLMNIIASISAYILSFTISMVINKSFDAMEGLTVLAITFFIFSFIQAIQLPIYFKLGYAKAKLLAYIPLAGLPLIIAACYSFFKESEYMPTIIGLVEWITMNPIFSVALCAIVMLSMLCISYVFSLNFYQRRDF